MAKEKAVSQKTVLMNTLKKMLKGIDEQGLIFLIEQAQILKYNLEVDAVNEKIKAVKGSDKKKSSSDTPKKEKKNVEIEAGEDKKTYILEIGSQRKFLTREEMKILTKICHGHASAPEIQVYFYNWLKKERQDILIDCGIRINSDPVISEIIQLIRSRYKVST